MHSTYKEVSVFVNHCTAFFSEYTLSSDGVASGMNPTGATTSYDGSASCSSDYHFIDSITGSCVDPGQDLGNCF